MLPPPLDRLWNAGVAVSWQIYQIPIVSQRVVVELLRAPRRLADKRKPATVRKRIQCT